MSRWDYTAQESYSTEPQVLYRTLVDLGVTSATLYVCNGAHYLYTLGNTYSPVGGLGEVELAQEETDPYPRTARLRLRAVNSADMYEPIREDMFGRAVKIWHTFIDPINYTPVATPSVMWKGKVNKIEMRFGEADRGTYYEVEAETDLARHSRVVNYTRETFFVAYAGVFSGDTGFDHVAKVAGTKGDWGGSGFFYSSPAGSSASTGQFRRPTPIPRAIPTNGG